MEDSRTESFAFLGYSFRGEKIYPRRESLSKIKARLVQLTARTRPGSIETICMELTSVLRGWFYYFRHCRWTIFADLDSKIRSRLRRLLLRRHRNNPMRENRPYGLEGGESGSTGLPYPYWLRGDRPC